MYLTGFADEAGSELATQIRATRELGWKFIESRAIGTKNLASLTDAEFEEVCGALEASGICINCFGSAVANWSRHPRKKEDFDASRKELLDAIPRMKKLNVSMIRGMSFLVPEDERPDSPELEKIIFDKVRELVRICEDNGIVYAHENCMNYGGMSHLHTLKLLDAVKSDSLRLVFDTGNPVFNYRRIGSAPYPLQSSWEFYKNVREFIVYVHIKDGTALPRPDGVRPECEFCYPGDGCGDVRAIVRDLKATGYDGGFSIEPHVASVFHQREKDSSSLDEVRYSSYVEYGRRFEKLLSECGWSADEISAGKQPRLA